ncbi:G1/S-specific cyclin CCN1 [Lachnellula suecica]|uniref:G1/S-specific cyclin CCN1 n=1 Tax=Lachnellula suecica TaxID=602035 RepID=A0A8T9CC75_9HELO|nr:G1/S-specific cyclin CCN1 [Lachnellula suecica]
MAYQKQPCDSYFVETHDSSHHQRAPQDYLKMLGRRKQEAMANELSRQACDAYMEDIMNHMKQMEDETLPDVASIDIQQEIQWFMRPYLIDFLIEAHAAFQLLPETLFLAVNLLDRYCSRRVVYKRHYQLVGCAALLIAAKYGDKKDRVPMIRELKSMCCSLYDEDMFTQMEWHVLNTLEWVIGHPTVDTWLQLALNTGPAYKDVEVEHLALYLSEIALYHKDFVSKKSSVMAAASLALARGILQRPETLDNHDHEVNQTIVELTRILDRPSQVLFRKYASPHMSRVANRLENILREQEEMQRRAMPPSPPAEVEVVMQHKPVPEAYPGTPQKPGPYGIVNGYMTPPITPEGEYFAGAKAEQYHSVVPRCPVTPTPYAQQHHLHHQQQYNQYQGMGVGVGMMH